MNFTSGHNMKRHQGRLSWSLGPVVLMVLLGAGCRSVSTTDVQAFSRGVTAARSQADVAFKGVTDLTSREIITYAASQPTLNDANFFVVLGPEATAAWDHVFTALEAYGRDLVLLTSPDLTQDYKDSAVNLAQQVQQTGEHLKGAGVFGNSPQTSTLLATAFTKLGDVLLKARAHAEAKKILLATDSV